MGLKHSLLGTPVIDLSKSRSGLPSSCVLWRDYRRMDFSAKTVPDLTGNHDDMDLSSCTVVQNDTEVWTSVLQSTGIIPLLSKSLLFAPGEALLVMAACKHGAGAQQKVTPIWISDDSVGDDLSWDPQYGMTDFAAGTEGYIIAGAGPTNGRYGSAMYIDRANAHGRSMGDHLVTMDTVDALGGTRWATDADIGTWDFSENTGGAAGQPFQHNMGAAAAAALLGHVCVFRWATPPPIAAIEAVIRWSMANWSGATPHLDCCPWLLDL